MQDCLKDCINFVCRKIFVENCIDNDWPRLSLRYELPDIIKSVPVLFLNYSKTLISVQILNRKFMDLSATEPIDLLNTATLTDIPTSNVLAACTSWMLEITHRIASKYHIEFEKDKSKLMIISDQIIPHEIKIGDMNLDVCDMYKYLGMVINKLNNLTDQIKGIKGKTEITYQTILALTGNEEMNEIETAASWELIENTIIPIITYVSETWNPPEKEIKELNTILDNILKVLITPYTTPRESLYIETGLMECHVSKRTGSFC